MNRATLATLPPGIPLLRFAICDLRSFRTNPVPSWKFVKFVSFRFHPPNALPCFGDLRSAICYWLLAIFSTSPCQPEFVSVFIRVHPWLKSGSPCKFLKFVLHSRRPAIRYTTVPASLTSTLGSKIFKGFQRYSKIKNSLVPITLAVFLVCRT